jgi:DNA-directed RNA polymerase specialized sigma24 family protein
MVRGRRARRAFTPRAGRSSWVRRKAGRQGESALAQLCRNYWYPLYMFARRRGHSPDDAQDLTQGFFLHLLHQWALASVDRLKGKFRSFFASLFPEPPLR